jgi:hypothetical protein
LIETFGEPHEELEASIIQTHEMGVEKGFGKFGVCMMPRRSVNMPPHGVIVAGYLVKIVDGVADTTRMVLLHLANITASMK